jgi:hypothetical protein
MSRHQLPVIASTAADSSIPIQFDHRPLATCRELS